MRLFAWSALSTLDYVRCTYPAVKALFWAIAALAIIHAAKQMYRLNKALNN